MMKAIFIIGFLLLIGTINVVQKLMVVDASSFSMDMQQAQQIWQIVKQNRLIDANFIESNNSVEVNCI